MLGLRFLLLSVMIYTLGASPSSAAVGEPSSPLSVNQNDVSPPRYFEFAADVQVSPAKMRQLVQKYGKNIMIGGDPANDDFESAMSAASKIGVKKHVYLEGPGGPTGNRSSPDPDELERMRSNAFAAARSVGVSINKSNWRSNWNKGLWLDFAKMQIKKYQSKGFSSFEIDNLDQNVAGASGADRDPTRTVQFYRKLQAWMDSNRITMTILMKNQSPKQLSAVRDAINDGRLRRSLFSDFAISESTYDDDPGKMASIAKSIGVQVLRSGNTYDYAAKGTYRADPPTRSSNILPSSALH